MTESKSASEHVHKIISVLKSEYPLAKYYLTFSNTLELMVAAILSPQVRDEIVNEATKELFKKYKTAEAYAESSLAELESFVKNITFYKNKAKNIQGACKMLLEKHDGKVPDDMDNLIALPGIGRKTAIAILLNGFGKVLGIPVDTHVIRVGYRLGLTKNRNPDKIEKDLMEIISKEDWKKISYLLKDHGRNVCRAPVPLCSKCALQKICPKNGVEKES